MFNLIDLSQQRILVTGASAGIGRQIAITLGQLGASVVLVARSKERLLDVISEMEGTGHSYYVADLAQIEMIAPLVKRMVADGGPFDGFVHSAGCAISCSLQQSHAERLHGIMQINFYAFYELVRTLSRKGNYGPSMSVVGISSVASALGTSALSAYSATKGAMDSTVRALALELHKKHIRVNSVRPSMIDTEMYHAICHIREEIEQELLQRQYLGIGTTIDVANAVAFLLSAASRYITGITLPVDGGHTSC